MEGGGSHRIRSFLLHRSISLSIFLGIYSSICLRGDDVDDGDDAKDDFYDATNGDDVDNEGNDDDDDFVSSSPCNSFGFVISTALKVLAHQHWQSLVRRLSPSCLLVPVVPVA